ncbi:MAG: hypothetical protein K5696_13375 [Lachnospiraceae bacterium]|nr:hypothetical protein [Lachnospiraceae bacterium]
MKQNSNSNTALFLMELIVVIAFFSLVSVVCVRLFVYASQTGTRSVNVGRATRAAESLAEIWIFCDGDLDRVTEYYPGQVPDLTGTNPEDGTLTLCYDENWQILPAGRTAEAAYSIVLTGQLTTAREVYGAEAGEGQAVTASILAQSLKKGTPLGDLHIDHYLGDAKGGAE